MKTLSITLVMAFTAISFIAAQNDKNPVLKNYYSSYSMGRVVCIGTSSYETELRATDIKTQDLENIINDYNNSLKSYNYRSLSDIVKDLETKQREIKQLVKQVETYERKFSDLERRLSDLERKLK